MKPVCTAGHALEQVARQITFDFQIRPHDVGLEAGSTVDIGGEVHGVERTLVLRALGRPHASHSPCHRRRNTTRDEIHPPVVRCAGLRTHNRWVNVRPRQQKTPTQELDGGLELPRLDSNQQPSD